MQVVLDEDGTEIDDNDVLVELATATKEIITLMVLESENEWIDKTQENLVHNSLRSDTGASSKNYYLLLLC